jgi:protein-disulfide isomerase
MAKRKKRAAEPQPAESRAARKASPKVLIAAGVLAAVAVAAIVIGARGGSSESATEDGPTGSSGKAASVQPLPHAAEVEKLYDGIQQQGNQLGDPNAPVAMVEYVDIQCPYCAQFETQAMPPLIRKYVADGKVFLESRPIASLGADSQRGRLALVAAGLQGKFFQLAHLLYLNQGTENTGWLTDKVLRRAAAGIDGLDPEQMFTDMSSSTAVRQGGIFDNEARAAAIQVTPTIYVGKNGGNLQPVAPAFPGDDATIARAIEAALGS